MHGLHIFNSPLINRINPDGISHAKLESIAKGYEFRGVVNGEEEDCLIGRYMKWIFLYNNHIFI